MSLVLLVPVVALAAVAAATAGLASRTARSLAALRDDVDALVQLRVAREHLLTDLERTRGRLDRPTDVWPAGPGR